VGEAESRQSARLIIGGFAERRGTYLTLQNENRPVIFYGWWIVAACSLIGLLASSARFSFTIYLPVLLDDLGWTRATLGFGFTLGYWVSAVTSLTIGVFVDRYGARMIMAAGGVIVLAGLVFASTMSSVWEFYLFYGVVLSVGLSLAHGVPSSSTVRKWFNRRAGLAVSLATVGGGLGLGLIAYLAPGMINAYGWRASWLYLGLGLGVSIVVIALTVIRKDPESMGLAPDGGLSGRDGSRLQEDKPYSALGREEFWTAGEAIKTRSYWCLVIGHALLTLPMMSGLTHMAAWGLDIADITGITAKEAMGSIKLSIFLSAIGAVTAAFAGGALSDKVGRKPVLCLSFILYAASLFYATLVSTLIPSLAGVIILGLTGGAFYGLGMTLWAAYVGDIFGRASLGALFGLLSFIGGVAGGTGPSLYGWIRDVTGSYALAWSFGGVCSLLAMYIVLLIKPEARKSRPY